MVVVIDYNVLLAAAAPENAQLMTDIERALGSNAGSKDQNAMGIICIRNVPGFVEAKADLLPYAHRLAHLPEDKLAQLEDPVSFYNAGWSHGREKLKPNVPDKNKASFYFNPVTDVPGTEADRNKYPASYPCNKWPKGSLPGLEPAAKNLGCIMKDVAILLAKHIDTYVADVYEKKTRNENGGKTISSDPGDDTDNNQKKLVSLFEALNGTEKVKGRLLYYYPLEAQMASSTTGAEENGGDQQTDTWIGWHNDSGFLTALAGDMFMDPSTGKALSKGPEDAGLQVVDRSDTPRGVSIPSDCMAIQIGECAQILTGGIIAATPHSVRGAPGIARASLACFIDTPPDFLLEMPGDITRDEVIQSQSSRLVPPLALRWKETGMTFGDFLQTTFEHYYNW